MEILIVAVLLIGIGIIGFLITLKDEIKQVVSKLDGLPKTLSKEVKGINKKLDGLKEQGKKSMKLQVVEAKETRRVVRGKKKKV